MFALVLTDTAINLITANNTEHEPYHRAVSFVGAQLLPVLYVDSILVYLLCE